MKKEQKDEANLLLWDRPKRMKGQWEIGEAPVVLQPEDMRVGADAIGWNVEVGKRDGGPTNAEGKYTQGQGSGATKRHCQVSSLQWEAR